MHKCKILFSIVCFVGFVERSNSSYYLNKIDDHYQNYGVQTTPSNFYRQVVSVFSPDFPHYNYHNNIANDLNTIFKIILNYERGNKHRANAGLNQYNIYNNQIFKRNFKGPKFVQFQIVPLRKNEKRLQFQEITKIASNHIKDGDDTSTTTEPAGLLGIPVMVPIEDLDQMVFKESSEEATRKQCVQDCQSSSSYNPVCGSNNVTFFNEEKFLCARNCGIDIFVSKRGECE